MNTPPALLRATALTLSFLTLLPAGCHHSTPSTTSPTTLTPAPDLLGAASPAKPLDPTLARIRDEGLNHSQVMTHLNTLCNAIGPRLTGSPNQLRASNWTCDTLASWGLANAHLEPWGPFGKGWAVERFSLQMTAPTYANLIAYPKAWSPGLASPLEGEPIYLNPANLDAYAGKLAGKIVLIGDLRELDPRFEPLATRTEARELEKLAAAKPNTSGVLAQARAETANERRAQFAAAGGAAERILKRPTTRATTGPTSRATTPLSTLNKAFTFAAREGAALILTPSTLGDGGTYFVAQASVPGVTAPAYPRAWSFDAPPMPPQVTLGVEDFNRLVRILELGITPKLRADLAVQYSDAQTFNTIAEIPGTDPALKDQVVMLGGHLDSWHSGTGATDNAAGVSVAMEAVRILKTLNLKPRRTIRIALWTGEEEGTLGSKAYVKAHFGTTQPSSQPSTAPSRRRRSATNPSVIEGPEFDNLSVYFNLDNGAGKVRGIFAQSNPAAAPIFSEWMKSHYDLGATTVTLSNTGSTDHIPFDDIGLPAFQFIQDALEYASRTHHSNMDTYDRIVPPDLQQASVLMASFVWQAANMDDRFPRKK